MTGRFHFYTTRRQPYQQCKALSATGASGAVPVIPTERRNIYKLSEALTN